jgi:protein-S-isoprenylcysteine O-methyltransferase Ste14
MFFCLHSPPPPLEIFPAAHAKALLVAVLVFMTAVSLYTPLAFLRIAQRRFTLPKLIYLAPVPILTALVALAQWRWIEGQHDLARPSRRRSRRSAISAS